MKIEQTIQKLEEYRPDGRSGDWVPCRLGVVLDDLEKVMLGIFEDHEDALILEDDLDEIDDVGVG